MTVPIAALQWYRLQCYAWYRFSAIVRTIIRNNTNACFDHFTERLKELYPQLTEEEINFCCLVKMELPLSVLAEIYHIAKGSISRKKMRLKEKIGIENMSFDEFIASL